MEYTVNLVLALLFGIFLKIYDDIIDNKLQVNLYYVDLLKYFVITLFSIIFYNDAVFAVLWFLMAFISFLMDKYYTCNLADSQDTLSQKDFTCMNEDVWFYSLLLSGGLIIYHLVRNLNHLKSINIGDTKNITFFISIVINLVIVVADIYFTPEHASDKKLYARIGMLMLLVLFFYYMTSFAEYIYEGNYGILLMNIGFLIGSVSFLTLNKLQLFDTLKNKL